MSDSQSPKFVKISFVVFGLFHPHSQTVGERDINRAEGILIGQKGY
jgi:hypothetical protein